MTTDRPRLTLDQRAQRRATRKSNEVKREYPLLAQAGVVDDWMTTREQARSDLERLDRAAAAQLQKLAEAHEAARQRAVQLRAQVAERVDADTLALLDAHFARTYPASYADGFWRRVLDGKFDIHAYNAEIEQIRRLGEEARNFPNTA